MPKLDKIKNRLGLISVAVLSLMPLGGLIFLWQKQFVRFYYYVFSGQIFVEKWARWMARGSLDQSGVFKFCFWFVVLSVPIYTWLTAIRFTMKQDKASVRWAYLICSAPSVVFLTCLLMIWSNWLRLYIANMGFTSHRLLGVLIALVSYAWTAWFVYWVYIKKQAKNIKE